MITVEGANCLAYVDREIEMIRCPEIDKDIPRESCELRQKDKTQKVCFGGCKSKGVRKKHIGVTRFKPGEALKLGLMWEEQNRKGTPKMRIAEQQNVSEAIVHRFINIAREYKKIT